MAFAGAIKLDEHVPASAWSAVQRAQIIATRPIDLEQFARLDHLLTAPIHQLMERAHATSSARGREVLALRDASIADALTVLGATKRYVRAITDDRWAVAFSTIKDLIKSACADDALNPDSLLYSVVGTRLAAGLLTEGADHHGT